MYIYTFFCFFLTKEFLSLRYLWIYLNCKLYSKIKSKGKPLPLRLIETTAPCYRPCCQKLRLFAKYPKWQLIKLVIYFNLIKNTVPVSMTSKIRLEYISIKQTSVFLKNMFIITTTTRRWLPYKTSCWVATAALELHNESTSWESTGMQTEGMDNWSIKQKS